MGEQSNLTEENVDELKAHLEEMKKDNPELEYRFFPQDEKSADASDTITLVKELLNKVDALDRKLDLIFDGHVLMDGHFVKASDLHSTLGGPGNLVM